MEFIVEVAARFSCPWRDEEDKPWLSSKAMMCGETALCA